MMEKHGIQNHPTFTGKERDEETGYGYFGARYMDHELTTMWLSVDPMVDKYPSISPYAYCAWNPVRLVDPDGREIGDYYDKNGTYLGWDGKYDDNVYIITNMSDQMMIKENNRKGGSTPLSDLSEEPCLATTYTALKASIEVGNRTKDNGGLNEECSLVDGRLIYKGKMGSHSIVHLPPHMRYLLMMGFRYIRIPMIMMPLTLGQKTLVFFHTTIRTLLLDHYLLQIRLV